MAKPKNPRNIRTYRDVDTYLTKAGCRRVEGGSHTKYYDQKGNHIALGRGKGNQDIPTGTRSAIIKAIIALGLGLFTLALWYFWPALTHYGIV